MEIKKTIKKIIPEKYHWSLYNFYKNNTSWRSRSYSSFGEDQVIAQLTSKKRNGFYVDVGAFHPFKYSNTYYFYKYFNWSGINIDPNPVNFNLFNKYRPRDINLNIGVSNQNKSLIYFMFSDGLYNTFNSQRKEELVNQGIKLINEKEVPVKPLSLVLEECLYKKEIDFLNIDVEMFDLEVLKSMNWNLKGPEVIAIEDHSLEMENCNDSKIFLFLKDKKYRLESKCHFTSIYKRN